MQAVELRFEQQLQAVCDESENKKLLDVLDDSQLQSLTFNLWRCEFLANDR